MGDRGIAGETCSWYGGIAPWHAHSPFSREMLGTRELFIQFSREIQMMKNLSAVPWKKISAQKEELIVQKQNKPPQKLDWKNTTTPFINHFTEGTHFIYYPFFSSILNITRSHDLADRPSLKARCLCISIWTRSPRVVPWGSSYMGA